MKPWLKKGWCIPPDSSADFVFHMEDVLEVYSRPYDPLRPVICMDETSKQLIGETRNLIPAKPGQEQRIDYEYVRNGVCNLFMFFEPIVGWRNVEVTDRRTRTDWALCVRDMVDVYYPHAEHVVLVMDNLNTHSPASLYETFEPAEAKRIAERLEIHYTPRHGSWLNMAEIEFSALGRQCLNRRIPDKASLEKAVKTWNRKRNAAKTKVNWRFSIEDARQKLKKLYPSFDDG